MSVVAYILAFIGISVVLAIGGMICESEALSDKLLKIKHYLSVGAEVVLFVLMIPALVVFRAASAMGIERKEDLRQ